MKSNKKPIISQTKELKNSLIKEVKKRSTTKELDSVTIKQKSSFMFNRSKTLRIDDLLKTNTAYCKSTIKSKAITNDIEKMPTELHPKKDNKIQDFEVEKKIEELSGKIAKIKELIKCQDSKMNTLNNELEIERKLAIKLAEENSQLLNQQEEQRKFRENYFQREIPKIQQVYNEMIQQASDNYETRQLQQFYPDIDNMTQEEILRLQESIGFVQTVEEVDKTSKIQEEKFDIVKFKNKNYLRECTICQEEFIEGDILKRLKCDHFYHKNCIKDWLLYNKKCPLCKNEI